MWQPIATAPKDGTPVLLWSPTPIDRMVTCPGLSANTAIGFWLENSWRSVDCEDTGSMGSSATGWMEDWEWIKIEPTYWQSMEAP